MPLPVARNAVLDAAADPTAERARISCKAAASCEDSCCGLLAVSKRPRLFTAACHRSSAVFGSLPLGFNPVGHVAPPASSWLRNVSPRPVTVPVKPSATAMTGRFCQNAGLAELGVTVFGRLG